MTCLENNHVSVKIKSVGAELASLVNKSTGTEHIWQADPAVWAKSSPILFPIVGTLKDNRYFFEEKSYELGRHGFAREKEFSTQKTDASTAVFTLRQDDPSLRNYPFPFLLTVTYTLEKDTMTVSYRVVNEGPTHMYFSIGAHPAFSVPFVPGTTYSDYFLEFEKAENAGRWPISKDGLIEASPMECLSNTHTLPLKKELFSKDALVFKDIRSSEISLRSSKSEHGLRMNFPGFPYLGLWSTKGGDFVCIEPWCGIADSVDTDQQFEQKEGIYKLAPGAEFVRAWSVTVF
ncbi:MAG: aldose 1-epimerase family protein [Gemmatimonadaceae bacterium]|nr:aldose 1-epimerase family protein [Chitinophagaceae bacterium]